MKTGRGKGEGGGVEVGGGKMLRGGPRDRWWEGGSRGR